MIQTERAGHALSWLDVGRQVWHAYLPDSHADIVVEQRLLKLPVRSLPRYECIRLWYKYLIERYSHNCGCAFPVDIPWVGEKEC